MQAPSQCKFAASEGKGLKMSLSKYSDCKNDDRSCCYRDPEKNETRCSKLATCHLTGQIYYLYGTFEAEVRFAHYQNGEACPDNALSYFSMGYTNSPIHNEITIGINGNKDRVLHLAYWYDCEMQQVLQEITFDPCRTFNVYKVVWEPDSITWSVNGRVLLITRGVANRTIPYLPISPRLILRATGNEFADDVFIQYKYFKYTPLNPQQLAMN